MDEYRGLDNFNDSVLNVASTYSELDHVEQAYAVGTGMLIKKLMNSVLEMRNFIGWRAYVIAVNFLTAANLNFT